MPLKVNPLNTWTALIAILLTIFSYAVIVSNGNGALQQQVKSLAENQQRLEGARERQDEKLDKHSESLSRIEAKLDDIRQVISSSRSH